MTNFTKADQSNLYSAKQHMLALTRNNRRTIHYVDFLLLYWDRDTIDMVNTVKAIVQPSQLDAHSPIVSHTINATHPVFPCELNLTYSVQISEPPNMRVLWPKVFAIRNDCDMAVHKVVETMFTELGAEAIDRGLFDEVCDFMIGSSPSFEASCYLFPPFMSLMKRAGYRQLANALEGDVKRVPKLPALPYLMRQKIRHVNEWFAIQELLGTWESERQPKPSDHLEVTLHGNHSFIKHYDDMSFDVKLTS